MKHLFTLIAVALSINLFANPTVSTINQLTNTDGVVYFMKSFSIDNNGTLKGVDVQGEAQSFSADEIQSLVIDGESLTAHRTNSLSSAVNSDGVLYHFETLEFGDNYFLSGTDVQATQHHFTRDEIKSFTINTNK